MGRRDSKIVVGVPEVSGGLFRVGRSAGAEFERADGEQRRDGDYVAEQHDAAGDGSADACRGRNGFAARGDISGAVRGGIAERKRTGGKDRKDGERFERAAKGAGCGAVRRAGFAERTCGGGFLSRSTGTPVRRSPTEGRGRRADVYQKSRTRSAAKIPECRG